MGKGTDLAREIIEMTKQYNKVIQARDFEIGGLKDDIDYLQKKVNRKSDMIEKLEQEKEALTLTLETITDIVCAHIVESEGKDHHYIESIWDWENDYKKILDILKIEVDVSKTEEDKENED